MTVSDTEPRYQLLDSNGNKVGTLYINADGDVAIQEGTNQNEVTLDSTGTFTTPALDADDLFTEDRAADYILTTDGTTMVAVGDESVVSSASDLETVIDAVQTDMGSEGGKAYLVSGSYPTSTGLTIDHSHFVMGGAGLGFWEENQGGDPATATEGQGPAKVKVTANVDGITFAQDADTATRMNAPTIEKLYLYGPGRNTGTNAFNFGTANTDQPVIRDILIHKWDTGLTGQNDAANFDNVTVMDTGPGDAWNLSGIYNTVQGCSAYDVDGDGFTGDLQYGMVTDFGTARCYNGFNFAGTKTTFASPKATDNRNIGFILTSHGNTVTGLTAWNNASHGADIGGGRNNVNGVADSNGGSGIVVSSLYNSIDVVATNNTTHGVSVTSDKNRISATTNGNGSDGVNVPSNENMVTAYCENNTGDGLSIGGDLNTVLATTRFNTNGISISGIDNMVFGNFPDGVTDNGTRTVVNGNSTNAGDPNTTGQWNTEAARAYRNGVVVWDTSTATDTPYRAAPDGSWVAI